MKLLKKQELLELAYIVKNDEAICPLCRVCYDKSNVECWCDKK